MTEGDMPLNKEDIQQLYEFDIKKMPKVYPFPMGATLKEMINFNLESERLAQLRWIRDRDYNRRKRLSSLHFHLSDMSKHQIEKEIVGIITEIIKDNKQIDKEISNE